MKIYLVQHAKARSEEEDSARPLNEEGIKEIKNINRFLKNLKIKVSCIYHSEKLRAKQTALVLNESINSDRGTEELKGLKPNDDPAVINNLVNMQSDDLMLVGHLPFMNKLANLMITGDQNADIISFVQGAVACLEKNNGTNKFQLIYIIRPDMI